MTVAAQIAATARALDAAGHGLRGPLQNIRNSLFLMERDPAHGNRHQTQIAEQIALLAAQLDDLAGLSLALRPPALAEHDAVEVARGALVEIPGASRIEVGQIGPPAAVWIDAELVALAVRALVRNAQEASAHAPVRVLVRHGQPLLIEVSDAGHWVPPDPLERVYDPYYSTKGRTLGLGLPTAFAVARGHGGAILIHCGAPGTTVRLQLPGGMP